MHSTGWLRMIAMMLAFVGTACQDEGPFFPDPLQPAEPSSLENMPFEQLGGGMIVFQREDGIHIVDLDSRTTSIIRTHGLVSGVSIAPDRSRIAYSRHVDFDTGWDIFTVSPDGTGVTRVSSFDNGEAWPTWTPDGNAIVAKTGEGDGNSVHLFGVRPQAAPAPIWYIPPSFFPPPAGRFSRSADSTLVFANRSYEGFVFRYAGYMVDTLYTPPDYRNVYTPTFSPDGDRIAFLELDGDGGRTRVRVVNSEGGEVRTVANLAGGRYDRVGYLMSYIDASLCWLDDNRIVFVKPHRTSVGEEYSSLYMVRADGTGLVRITTREITTDSVSCAR